MNVKLKYDLGVDNTTLTVTHGRKQLTKVVTEDKMIPVEILVDVAKKILKSQQQDANILYEPYTDFEYSYKLMEGIPIEYVDFTYRDSRFTILLHTLTLEVLLDRLEDVLGFDLYVK